MNNLKIKTIYLLIIIGISSCITRIKSNTILISNDYTKAYQSARNSGDMNLSITYMNLLANYSKDSIQYFDSLSNLYYNTRYYSQAIYWSMKSLNHNDSNFFALSILGRSYQRQSDFIPSIGYFEKLIKIDNKPEHYLYLTESQYRAKRLLECIQTSLKSENFPTNYDYKYLYVDSLGNKRMSNVKSAIINFRGLAYYELGEYVAAKKAFEESLLYDPEFLLAGFNLKTVSEKVNKTK